MNVKRIPLLKRLVPTDDWDEMTPRKLVLLLMAWSPLVLTGGLGLYTRGATDPYEFASGESMHRRVMDYAPLIRAASEVRPQQPDVHRAEEISREWIAKFASGHLVAPQPAFFEDTMNEGVKAQIAGAAARLTSVLLDEAKSRESEVPPEQRVERALLAMRLAETLKYADFPMVYQANRDQARAIQILEQLAPRLSEDARIHILAQLDAFRSDEKRLSGLAQTMRRHYAAYLRRRGLEPISIQEAQRNVALTEDLRNGQGPSIRVISRQLFAANEDAPKFLTEFKLAWASVRNHEKALESLAGKLKTRPSTVRS